MEMLLSLEMRKRRASPTDIFNRIFDFLSSKRDSFARSLERIICGNIIYSSAVRVFGSDILLANLT